MTSKLDELSLALAPVSETARLDAQVLLAHVMHTNRSWVLAHPEAVLSRHQTEQLADLLTRLLAGEPLPYVLGRWEFYALGFHITRDVLIPRPETELLVDTALAWLRARPRRRYAADVGTGSGCIAISLAAHLPDLHVLACDISEAALAVARSNAREHAADARIDFRQGDLLAFDNGKNFDLICANLPYIPTTTLHALQVYGREPTLALDGGADGLDLIRRLLEQAPSRLASGGLLLAEIEERQGHEVSQAAQRAFSGADISILKDLSSKDRLLRIQQ